MRLTDLVDALNSLLGDYEKARSVDVPTFDEE
jgi:hypothetical protein